MTDLEKIIENQIQYYKDYKDLDSLEFLLKYEYNFKDDIIKDYKTYLKDNEDEDQEELLGYNEWIEEYKEEVGDDLQEKINEYFNDYGIDIYKGDGQNIYNIMIAGGGPNIYVRVEDKFEVVLLKGYWGGEEVIKDISYLYDTLYDVYNLDLGA